MMLNIKSIVFLVVIFISLSQNADAQVKPLEVFEKYRTEFPDESGVITERRRVITIKKNGDSLDIQTSQYKEVLILDKPLRWVKEQVYSNSFSKVDNVEAFTLSPRKKKYKKVEVEEYKKSYDKDTYVFFDDTEVINFNFPQVVEGSKIVTSQSWKSTDPHILGSFYFSSYVPTLHASFKVIVEEGIEINHGIVNDSLYSISLSEEVLKDGSKVYTYEAYDIPKINFEDDNPGFGHLSPSAFILIANYKNSKGELVPVLSSVDDLHDWYRTFVDDMEVNNSLHKLSRKIVNEQDSIIDKVRKIFYWVQANIKYIAFEDGMRGFIPHQADYVVEKRYGDCKDMTSILVGLLRSQDIDANFTWIGTRDIPYRYTEIPSPIVDNHMIASVEVDNHTYFLDATGSYTPLGYPTSMIQGKESLISKKKKYRIMKVPEIPKEQNQMNDTSTIWLDDGIVYGEGRVTLSGLAKVANTYKLIQKTTKAEDSYVRRLLSRGNNKFLVDSYHAKHIDNLDVPIEIDYTFNVADYYKEVGNEIYVNLCLDRSLINQSIKNRTTPLENDYKFISTSYTTLKVPEGYKVKYLPEEGSFSSSQLGIDITYKEGIRSVIFESSIYIDFLILYPKSFESWNEVIDEYSRLTRRTLVLEKIK